MTHEPLRMVNVEVPGIWLEERTIDKIKDLPGVRRVLYANEYANWRERFDAICRGVAGPAPRGRSTLLRIEHPAGETWSVGEVADFIRLESRP